MAVTRQFAFSVGGRPTDYPAIHSADGFGDLQVLPFEYTQDEDGDAGSECIIGEIHGKGLRFFKNFAVITPSAELDGATLKIGYERMKPTVDSDEEEKDEAWFGVVTAAADTEADIITHDWPGGMNVLHSLGYIRIVVKVEGAPIPAGATLKGYFFVRSI